MKEYLSNIVKNQLIPNYDENWTSWNYLEDTNKDVIDGTWLENRTSFIYKVGVSIAIDANKSDWVYLAIGVQRQNENSSNQLIGTLSFPNGENGDIGRVVQRAVKLMRYATPLFDH